MSTFQPSVTPFVGGAQGNDGSRFAGPTHSATTRDWRGVVAKVCLNAFLVVAWLTGASQFISDRIGENAGRILNFVGVATYPLFLVAAVILYETSKRPAVPIWRAHVVVYSALIVLLSVYGYNQGNALRVMALDSIVFTTLLGVFVIGRRNEVWNDVRTTVIVLSAAAVALCVTYTDSTILIDRGILNDEAGAHFETGLVLAPLFCIASAFDRRVIRYYLFLALSIGSFFVYLYFGRRGISIRCGLELFLAGIVLPALAGRVGRLVSGAIVLSFLVAALLFYFPFETLIDRFLGSSGVMATITVENERWDEVQIMFSEFTSNERMIGRGIGGAFLVDDPSTRLVLDKIDSDRMGRIGCHAGAFFPVLKGGLILALIYFTPLLRLLWSLHKWRRLDPITLGAAAAGVIMLGFQFVEGAPTYATPWVTCLIALIMSRSQNARWTGKAMPAESDSMEQKDKKWMGTSRH